MPRSTRYAGGRPCRDNETCGRQCCNIGQERIAKTRPAMPRVAHKRVIPRTETLGFPAYQRAEALTLKMSTPLENVPMKMPERLVTEIRASLMNMWP